MGGICGGPSADFDHNASGTKAWDKHLQNQEKAEKKIHKLLLLGTGNSGKSTFFKQLTQIHCGGFKDEEFESSARHIQDSIVVQMKNLLNTFKKTKADGTDEFSADLPKELNECALRVLNLPPQQPLNAVVDEIAQLWQHENIKNAYTNRTNLGIADSAPHFFDNIDRIRSTNYMPTAEDILLVRIPTTGMRTREFEIKGSVFNIFDVGGQRSERNKWIHCFDTVHGILFVSSLSCYDQMLYEENELNAMGEALELFSIVANSRYFRNSSLILFLNKADLFEEKIKIKSLTVCFSEYDGDGSFEDTTAFIEQKFKDRIAPNRDHKTVYTHITCATDQDNVKRVFDDVQHAVVTNALRHNGLI